jgi:hypothetical protein
LTSGGITTKETIFFTVLQPNPKDVSLFKGMSKHNSTTMLPNINHDTSLRASGNKSILAPYESYFEAKID